MFFFRAVCPAGLSRVPSLQVLAFAVLAKLSYTELAEIRDRHPHLFINKLWKGLFECRWKNFPGLNVSFEERAAEGLTGLYYMHEVVLRPMPDGQTAQCVELVFNYETLFREANKMFDYLMDFAALNPIYLNEFVDETSLLDFKPLSDKQMFEQLNFVMSNGRLPPDSEQLYCYRLSEKMFDIVSGMAEIAFWAENGDREANEQTLNEMFHFGLVAVHKNLSSIGDGRSRRVYLNRCHQTFKQHLPRYFYDRVLLHGMKLLALSQVVHADEGVSTNSDPDTASSEHSGGGSEVYLSSDGSEVLEELPESSEEEEL